MNIAIGSDHGGFAMKEHLRKKLTDAGHAVHDCGTFDTSACDYPTIAAEVARRISEKTSDRGIIIDGAGIGSSMTANKFAGVRAALCYDISSARNSREHNDANVLTLGASLIGNGLAEQIVDVFLTTDCTVDRHRRRVELIEAIEKENLAHPCACRGHAEADPPKSAVAAVAQEIANVSDLSNEDLERIANRIAAMIGPTGWSGGLCACCGPDCRGHCAEKNPGAVRELIAAGAGRIAHGLGGGPISADVAKFIDHTLLKPEATRQQVEQLCKEALQFGFASVCINPSWVPVAAKILNGSSVAVCTVAGFPLGTHLPEIKAMEARHSIRQGAKEVDMVINIGALKSGDDDMVYRDIKAVTDACIDGRAISKVIIECALLTDDEKVRACQLAKRARADFVKTSTGFASGGATAADVALMSEAVAGTRIGVKAAGGIRTYDDVKKMIEAGATRIGASAGIQIIKEATGGTPAATATHSPAKSNEKY